MLDLPKRDKLKGKPAGGVVEDRIRRGREDMQREQSLRRLCYKFFRGQNQWWINQKGLLRENATVTTATGGKPPHRFRNSHNFIAPIVEGKVSAATQRVPSYDIVPATTDPEDVAAARLGEKVALFGYDKWSIRRATMEAVTHAIVMGEGFVMPYFDANVGPFVPIVDEQSGKPKMVGQGEIKLLVLSGNEVMWEPGCKFHESPWYAIERARVPTEVEELPGFVGGKLTADAASSEHPNEQNRKDMVMVTEYLERPCPRYPNGRHLIIANDRVIVEPEDGPAPYPCRDHNGQVLDEPVLHRISYTVDPEGPRDRGLVERLIDFQRTIDDCWNKLLEWKNRTLNPRILAPVGSLLERPDDTPGGIDWFNPVSGIKPEWQNSPTVPRELFQLMDLARQAMRDNAADPEVQAAADVAARTAQAAIEQANAQWQSFLGDLAEWHSRVMRHCLSLVAQYYTEPRLVAIRGRFGPELVRDFQGSQLRGQIDVRVFAGSIEPRTKQAITNQVLAYADRGWITPQAAMAAISGGTAEKLVESHELDIMRVNEIIQKIRDGSVFEMPLREDVDPMTGQPIETAGWMPREFDNMEVWRSVLGDWLKTTDFSSLPEPQQEVGLQMWRGMAQLEQMQQMQAAMAQQAQAEQLGMDNASKPQREAPMPDQRMPDMPQDPSSTQ